MQQHLRHVRGAQGDIRSLFPSSPYLSFACFFRFAQFIPPLRATPSGNPSGGGPSVVTPSRPPGGAKEGHAQRGYLVVTSCRPAYGDGCMRPPVPKAKLGTGGQRTDWLSARQGGVTSEFSALFQSFYNYPLCPPSGASEGPVVGNLRFPPRGPSLQPPPESPFPFRVERLPVRPASSCSNKSFAFGTLGLADTGSHGGSRPSPTSC